MPDELPPASNENGSPYKIVTAHQGLTIEIVPMRLKLFQVSEHDIDSLSSNNADINLAFFTLCLGALIAFWVVLDTGGVTDAHKHATYFMLTFASAVLSAFFGFQTFRAVHAHRRYVRDFKSDKAIK